MDLYALYRRAEDEWGDAADRKSHAPVKIMTPDGERFGILSLNWDDETGEWVLCGTDE